MFGEGDEYFDLDEQTEAMFRQMKIEVERIPNQSHDWLIFSPNKAAELVRSFLQESI